jgi:hypothetical protein
MKIQINIVLCKPNFQIIQLPACLRTLPACLAGRWEAGRVG